MTALAGPRRIINLTADLSRALLKQEDGKGMREERLLSEIRKIAGSEEGPQGRKSEERKNPKGRALTREDIRTRQEEPRGTRRRHVHET